MKKEIVMNKGLQDLLNDKKLMAELKLTEWEIKFLETIPPTKSLTKGIYVILLKEIREICKRHNIK